MLEDIKARIRTAQVKASLSVDREMIALYWSIGRDIVQRQREEGWGKAVVERLAADLQSAFPGIAGFSSSNIGRMKAFYLAWLSPPISAEPAPNLGGEDFYIDLLFYHLRLRCYVVIDLKARPFKPEYAGKMNFYVSAVDDLLRHADDKPSIGLILCKTRNKVMAEYALRDVAKPVGVARYVTRLVESLPAKFKGALPTPRDIEAELRKDEKDRAADE